MKLLLISQYYWPESFGASEWTTALAEWLHSRGHEVTVITGLPNYPDGIVFPEYRGCVFRREIRNGVRIVRTWLYATPRTRSIWQRVLTHASFSISLLVGLVSVSRPDVVWYASPPLPGAISAWLLSRIFGAAFILNISDIEPERSIALGLFKNRALIRLLNTMANFVHRHADRICVLSQGTKEFLTRKGVATSKIAITPNWANGDLIRPCSQEQSLRSEIGSSSGEFVVLYAGNMGYTMSDLETVVEAAQRLTSECDIRFVLAGDGVRRGHIEALAAKLNNVTLLAIQSRERYPRLLAAADLCLVLLNREGTYASVPSKTYSIMAAGRPFLAVCESSNDVARIARDANCGMQVRPGDVQALVEAIRRYRAFPLLKQVQGRNARSYFEQHFVPCTGMAAYENVFAEICTGPELPNRKPGVTMPPGSFAS